MIVNKVKEGRKLTEIKFSNDHYLANLLATTKVLGISLERAKSYVEQYQVKEQRLIHLLKLSVNQILINYLKNQKNMRQKYLSAFLVNNLSKVKYESNYYYI